MQRKSLNLFLIFFQFFFLIFAISGCYKVNRGEVYPDRLPDAIVNEPYSVSIHIVGGAILRKSDLHLETSPVLSNISILPMKEGWYNRIVLQGVFNHVGRYSLKFSGFGYSPIPLQLNHTYTLNVFDKASVCDYKDGFSHLTNNNKVKKQNFFNMLPRATFEKNYTSLIKFTSSNVINPHLSKNVKLVTYPKDSGIEIKSVNEHTFNIVEVYGVPKVIGNIEVIFRRYYINNPSENYDYPSYILPVIPDQSNCR